MATSGREPKFPRPSSLQGGTSISRTGAQSKVLHSEKDRYSCWSPFPMGQRPKNTLYKASSYLLQHLIHRYQESDVDRNYYDLEEGEGEVESEVSSESEMLNFEVCLPPTPHPLISFSSGQNPFTSLRLSLIPRAPCLQEHLFLTAPRLPSSPPRFRYPRSSLFIFISTCDSLRIITQCPYKKVSICMKVVTLTFSKLYLYSIVNSQEFHVCTLCTVSS